MKVFVYKSIAYRLFLLNIILELGLDNVRIASEHLDDSF